MVICKQRLISFVQNRFPTSFASQLMRIRMKIQGHAHITATILALFCIYNFGIKNDTNFNKITNLPSKNE